MGDIDNDGKTRWAIIREQLNDRCWYIHNVWVMHSAVIVMVNGQVHIGV